jgi:hypothetical protein
MHPATAPSTLAAEAVCYILQRVVNDRKFSYCMIGTEALHKCLAADAERRGMTVDAVEQDLLLVMHEEDKRRHVLDMRLDHIDRLLGRMHVRGHIEQGYYARLCQYIHVDPANWLED